MGLEALTEMVSAEVRLGLYSSCRISRAFSILRASKAGQTHGSVRVGF
jgi:hypothetical protein